MYDPSERTVRREWTGQDTAPVVTQLRRQLIGANPAPMPKGLFYFRVALGSVALFVVTYAALQISG